MILDLPPDAWRLIHIMLAQHYVPRHTAFPVIKAFEEALAAAQQPPAPADKDTPAVA